MVGRGVCGGEQVDRFVIAIDGLASSGKTTLSKLLAERLGFVHLNTGLLYRSVAHLALAAGTDVDDPAALVRMLAQHRVELRCDNQDHSSARLFVDGVDVTSAVQAPQVSEATSKAARHAEVRNALRALQRDAFPGADLVAEGRDMGTVVFPDAQVKFFIEADAAVRVERRISQLEGHTGASRDELKAQMLKEIIERDARDTGREVAPTKPASDSIIIDNSRGTLEQTLARMVEAVNTRRSQR